MTPLERVIQHVRAQGRAGTHQALLLAEVDRLRAEVARLESQIATLAYTPTHAIVAQRLETTNVC